MHNADLHFPSIFVDLNTNTALMRACRNTLVAVLGTENPALKIEAIEDVQHYYKFQENLNLN